MEIEKLIEAFNTNYPPTISTDRCIYCNGSLLNEKRRQIGKRYVFPKYLLKGITQNSFQSVPVHYLCVEKVLDELQKINGGSDIGRSTKFIIC